MESIFDAVRTVESVVDFTKRCSSEGSTIYIDFKKVFEPLRSWFSTVMHLRSHGIHTFYKNISSYVLN